MLEDGRVNGIAGAVARRVSVCRAASGDARRHAKRIDARMLVFERDGRLARVRLRERPYIDQVSSFDVMLLLIAYAAVVAPPALPISLPILPVSFPLPVHLQSPTSLPALTLSFPFSLEAHAIDGPS